MKNITTIITLYKPPANKLENLNQYKDTNLLIFEQETSGENHKDYKKIFQGKNIEYFFSKKNIGLSKSSNILLKKVKSKYCLFTQLDIKIDKKTIIKLLNAIKKKEDFILVYPNHKKNKNKKYYEITKNIDFSCILIDVEKMRKIGFFDEDFFLYWEDMYLQNKINRSPYKMAIINKAIVEHHSSQSSITSPIIFYIRSLNFIYGELIYDLKLKKLRVIKIMRMFIKNFFLFFFKILTFRLKESINKLAIIGGILKFIIFIFLKK